MGINLESTVEILKAKRFNIKNFEGKTGPAI